MPTPSFTPIDCGETVCGTIWADGGTRDTDWYQLVLTEANMVTWTGAACFDFVIGFVDTSDCSLASALDPYAVGAPEEVISVSRICGPGVYWLFASHQTFYDQPCGFNNDYWCEVTCEVLTEGACCYEDGSCVPGMEEEACYTSGGTSWLGGQSCVPNLCPQPPYECPPGATEEGEDCLVDNDVDDTNGGCNSTPNVFGSIECGETVCGETSTYLYGASQYRDTDWYTLVITENTNLTITGKSGFQLQVLLIATPTGDCSSYSIVGSFQVGANVEGTIVYPATPGTYWVWAGPWVFTGYPCSTGPWKYHVKVECEPLGEIYCPASGGGNWEYICNVAVGTINNPSGYTPYSDFTSICTDMEIGTGYYILVDNCNSYSSDECAVWVDWNQDIDFYDANEFFMLSGVGGGVAQFEGTITPPGDALPGETRMRVRLVDTSIDPIDPCGTTAYGEVEDYCIMVGGGEVPTCAFAPDPTLTLVKFAISYVEGAVYFTGDAVGGDLNDVTLDYLQPQGSSCTVPFDGYEIVPGGYGDLPGPVGKGTFDLREYVLCAEEGGVLWGSVESFFDVYYELALTPGSFECSVELIGHVPGDLNLDGKVNISDLTYLVNFLFQDGQPPQFLESADVNGSGSANVADVTYLVNYLFRDGPPPVLP
jgi:hypothetical protein